MKDAQGRRIVSGWYLNQQDEKIADLLRVAERPESQRQRPESSQIEFLAVGCLEELLAALPGSQLVQEGEFRSPCVRVRPATRAEELRAQATHRQVLANAIAAGRVQVVLEKGATCAFELKEQL